ncbi:GNAT family N-acetyltransferase [Caldibacillus debilis]|uniref:N-acetyltransferase domain-containing protein n=1 Tax=Caldibacillus debilis TaxID=301148 RepID=A0A150LEB7_9BACI|nr:GNAT family N-acetyltransferase [Caldibacillus debilis]KYD10306.1 hypothetical protein B4135_3481 [Caldibacillus debilis]
MDVVVRTAKEEDWENLWFLLEKRGGTDVRTAAEKRFLAYVQSPSHYIPVAYAGHQAVGYAWVQDYGPHLRTGKSIHRFHDLFVLAEYRNRGIGALLFQRIREWSEKNGASWLQWNANPASASFYRRLGFVPVPEEEEGFPFFEIEFQARE